MGAKAFGQQEQTTTLGDRNASALAFPLDYAVCSFTRQFTATFTMDAADLASLSGQIPRGGGEVTMPDK